MYIDSSHMQNRIKWNIAQKQQQSQTNLTQHIRPWGQKVKRWKSSVCPGRRISPLTTKITPQFPDCHQHNHNNPPVHFCSCAFKHVAIPNIFPLKQSSCQNKTNSVTNLMRIFSMKIIQSVQVKWKE